MIATQQKSKKVKGVKYKIGMKTDWVTHKYMEYYFVSIIGPCL